MDEFDRRLEAADPAQAYEPDAAAIRSRIETAVPTTGPAHPISRTGYPRRWVWTAAAGIALLFAGGGYSLGTYTGGSGDGGPGADGSREQPAVGTDDDGALDDSSSQAEQAIDGAAGEDRIADMFGGGPMLRFTSTGLDAGADEASAYTLTAEDFSADDATEIAASLGVDHDLEEEDGAYFAHSEDMSFTLGPDGTISFADATQTPWNCGESFDDGEPAEPDSEADGPDQPGTQPAGPAPADDSEPAEPCGPHISAEEATTAAQDLVRELGYEPQDYGWSAEDSDGFNGTVTADLVVEDQDLWPMWTFIVGEDGVAELWAQPAHTSPLGDYDVISPQDAAQRLNQRQYGTGGATPLEVDTGPEEDAPEIARGDAARADAGGELPAEGGRLPWPAREVVLTGAEPSWTAVDTGDGHAVLLPAYDFTAEDDSTWQTVAVEEDDLDFTVP